MDGLVWIVIVVAVVVIAFVGYGLARRARGSIELTLPKTAFEPGETIRGSFVLHTKQPIEAQRLVVRLSASEVTQTTEGGKTRSRSRRVFDDERIVEGEKSYPAEHKETHQFEIEVPDPGTPAMPASPVGAAMGTALRALASTRTRLRWRLEVRLVTKGIDLVAGRAVSVNLQRL